MCTPSAPPAPDYKLAAQQTAAGNQNAAIAAQYGNMTNQVGPQQYSYDASSGKYTPLYQTDAQGKQVLDAKGNPIPSATGVQYTNPAKLDSRGSMPFDMSTLTQKQKDAYYAGQGLPKDFVKTYDPQQWNQTQTLGANDQQLFNQSQATQLGLSGMALTGLDAVRNATDPKAGYTDANGKFVSTYKGDVTPSIAVQGGPASTTGQMITDVSHDLSKGGYLDTKGLKSSVDSAGKITLASGATDLAKTSVDNTADKIVTSSGANDKAYGLGATGNNSANLKTSTGVDPTLLNQQTQDALYKANTQYLDPQFTQGQAQLENKLANQGITKGSEAYNNAMLNFTNQKQQAYESARNQAISGSTAAAQGMFGMGLQNAQFANSALGQQFGQNVTAQQLTNAAAQQNNQNAQVNMGLTNQAYGQQFGQNLQANQFANAGIAQNNANTLANAQFANAAQGQQYGQNLSDMQAQNAAVNQRFGMDTANQADYNAANQQDFNMALTNANLQNEKYNTQYNQNLQSAQLSNQASNQQLAQNQAIQQNPLNILQALRTGAQLNTANLPQVGTSQPGQLANWQGADMLGAATAQGQYDQSVYNAQAAANAQMMSAGIGAAGALGGAGIGAAVKSDRRLKKNIKRIGTHVLGIGLYTWDYLWGEPFSGVMADEVEQVMPEAIVMHPSGFKMVNYEMLGLM